MNSVNRVIKVFWSSLFLSLIIMNSLGIKAQTVKKQGVFVVGGVVLDSEKLPLVGAYVNNLSDNNIVVVGSNGEFSIKAKKGDKLRFSFVGMITQVITIKGDERLRVVLRDDDHLLKNVVVTGYRKVNNRVFVGSAVRVKTDDLSQTAAPDISRMLQGRISGLNISDVSSSFGSAPKINIRGGSSINGSVMPLWVVDGVIYDDLVNLDPEALSSGDAVTLVGSAIAGINPQDVESVEVLKDASATSLYGARGMNGVIVVTTKAGKRSEGFHLNYSFETGVRVKPNINDYNLLDSHETMALLLEMRNKGYFSIDDALNSKRSGVFNQLYKGLSQIKGNGFAIENTETGRNKFLSDASARNTDWFSYLFTLNPTQNHTISIRYGGENVATYSSIGLFSDSGYSIADKVDRLTAYIKSTYFVNNSLDISVSLQGNYRKQRAPGTFPRIKYPEIGAFRRDFDINPFAYSLSTSSTLRPYDENGNKEYYQNDWAEFNIIDEIANNYIDINVADWRLQTNASWRITDDLRLSGLLSARSVNSSFEHFITENSNIAKAYRSTSSLSILKDNIYLYRPYSNNPLDAKITLPSGGMYNKNSRRLLSYLARISVDYNKRFGENAVNLFGFTEIRSSDNTSDSFNGYGISFNRGNSVNTSPYIFLKNINQASNYFSLASLYDRGVTLSASATYSYANKYVTNLVFNYEGSNIAGEKGRVRWLPTWNIGAKWNIDRESLINWKDYGISQFALRTSYGLVAKLIPQATNSMIVYQSITNLHKDINDRDHGIEIKSNENRDLTWEKMYELNIGVDLGLLDNRIMINTDLYNRNSFDLIDLVRTSAIGGEYYKWANFGDMNTKGIDLSINTKNIDTKDWKFSTTGIFSFYKQRITSLRNTPNAFDLVAGQGKGNVVGNPRSSLYSYRFTGLSDRGLPTFYFGDLPTSGEAYALSTAANFNDSRYVMSYLKYEGSTEPNISIGLDNRVSYKGWTLSCFISYQGGNVIRIMPTYDLSYNDVGVFSKDYANRWLVRGDEKKTNIPTIVSKDLINRVGKQNIERAYNTYNYSDVKVVDGSFIRMKNIALSYSLPLDYISKLKMQKVVLSIQAINPFLIYSNSKLNGQDPEFVNSGGVASPINKMYSFSMQINF